MIISHHQELIRCRVRYKNKTVDTYFLLLFFWSSSREFCDVIQLLFLLGDEDCLYLNIYTPYVNPKRKLNVLVFIHGGAFMFNHGGLYGPEILLDKDIVYVNINYRLGPLGKEDIIFRIFQNTFHLII